MNRKRGAVLLIVQRSVHARLVVPAPMEVVRHEIQLGELSKATKNVEI